MVVGNNAGQSRPPLRYAERDAGKFARLLLEIGEVAPQDLALLQGGNAGALEGAIRRVQSQVAGLQSSPDMKAMVLFFFSGHGDGEGIELGRDRVSFARLRAMLSGTGAKVRVGVIDACNSGSAVFAKGGAPAPGFAIRLTDDLATTGEAFITSSAADEASLESSELRGSFFTQHLLTGLRGAADESGDLRVSLAEAYRYAYGRTVSATALTRSGPQHPTYDYDLSGQGELALTALQKPSAILELPLQADRALVLDLARDEVIAELGSAGSAARPLALGPGEYGVRLLRDGQTFGGRVTLAPGSRRAVGWDTLSLLGQADRFTAKGGSPDEIATAWEAQGANALSLALGAAQPISPDVRFAGMLRLGYHPVREWPLWFGLQGSTGAGAAPDFRENSVQLRAGVGPAWQPDRAEITWGLEVGGGVIWQTVPGQPLAWTPVGAVAPCLWGRFPLGSPWWVVAGAEVSTSLLIVEGAPRLAIQPAMTIGVALLP